MEEYLVNVVTGLVLAVLAWGLKKTLGWMKEQDNVILHSIGEMAYREVERNVSTASGEAKMQWAISAAKERLRLHPRLQKIDDAKIISVVQNAWFQNEGQYKNSGA